MAETVEVPVALIEVLAERHALDDRCADAALDIIALLPPPPPTFTDEECLAFSRAMWPESLRPPVVEGRAARVVLTRLFAAGLKVVPVDG